MNPSHLTDEIRFPTERQVGFWKHESVPDHIEGMPLLHGNKDFVSLPSEKKLQLSNANPGRSLDSQQSHFLEEQKTKLSLEELVSARRINGLHITPWKHASSDFGPKSDMLLQPANIYTKGNTVDTNVHYENCLFSSSLSETFNRKVSLASVDAFICNSTDTIKLNFEEDELPFESLKEIEARTIGDLLPDDDDLLEHIVQPNNSNDAEEDIFCTVGGIEIEEVDSSGSSFKAENSYVQRGELNCSSVGEYTYEECPSRNLFVRNINSNVEDAELRNLFEKYGDIRTLYAVYKHRGFVMISYFDIRSACNAMRELQNMPLGHLNLDIHFSIPKSDPPEKDINQGTVVVLNLAPSISDGDLRQIFGVHGEIKEICEMPYKNDVKLIEFYDIRAAEAAVNALNMSYIAEKKIKVEPFHQGVARQCMMQQRPLELQQDKIGRNCNQSYPKNSQTSGYGPVCMGTSTFNNHDFGSVQGLNSVSQPPCSPFVINKFNRIPSSAPHDFFPSRSGPIGNHSNQSFSNGLSHPPGQKNDGSFHPYSLLEYHDKQSIPYNMENSTSAKAINIARSVEGVGNRCMSEDSMGSPGFDGQSFGHTERAIGASWNGSYPVPWHEYAWNNSFRSPPGTAILPHSPSFTNSIPCHPSTQSFGFPRRFHMLNTVSPATQYHVGSAPTANLPIWNRHQAYEMNPTDTSVFHPGSLGSKEFSGSPVPNTSEHVSHNIFPHVNRTFMDPPTSAVHVGLPPPHQSCHIFRGREDMISMPNAFYAHRDRVRCRRSDISSNQADNKKQFEFEIERIISGEDSRTTLMIKNIPNKYTSKMLLATIDEHHPGTYDFIYLPIDFKNKCNVGYAFINMIDPQQIVPFHKTFNGKKWEKFNSEKVASLTYARIQGKAALVAHFQNSSLMNEDRRCRPIIFRSNGPNAGEQEPFPMGINIRSRHARPKSHKNEDDHDDVPSNFATDEISTGVMPSSPTNA